jgi:hypothetical protein
MFKNIVPMNPSPTSGDEPDEQVNSETIPPDAPFIFINLEKTTKVVVVSRTSTVTKTEFERLKAWFEDQFFIVDEGENEASEDN